ncbi:MAG TPA: hypothetical protein VNJ03_12595 [Vicinamibacterales bacterium]|nr:hypothetical protein [Vicinamibacterales bacterium]
MTRRSGLVAIDALLLALAVLSLVVAETGGGAVRIAGVRVSVQTWWRPVVGTLILMVIRVWAYRTTPPFGTPWSRIIDRGRPSPLPVPAAREQLLALMALAAVSVVYWPQFAHLDRVPDLGDPLFSMWRLAWVDHQILANPLRLFHANIFFPTAAALTLSDSMILPGLTAIPLLRSGIPLSVAYNILLMSGFVLSALAAFVLARALGFGVIASWVAGLYFGLCPFRLDHYSHLELQMTQWMPLALLSAHRVMATGRWRYVVWLGVVLAAQWYSSMYFGMFLTLYVAVFALALAVAWRCWRPLTMVALGTVAGVVLALPLAHAYGASEHDRGLRSSRDVTEFSAVPLDYLQTTPHSALYGEVQIAGPRLPERVLFPGAAPIALAAVSLAPPLNATRAAFLLAGVAAFDGSLGLNGHWYPWAYQWVGPFQSIRAPARFAMLVSLSSRCLRRRASTGWPVSRVPRVCRGSWRSS